MKRQNIIFSLATVISAIAIFLAVPRYTNSTTLTRVAETDIGSTLMRQFKAPSRDPFSAVQGVSTAQAPVVPTLKLIGIMYSDSAPEAIINTPDGQSKTLKTGDSVAGETILQITRDYIMIQKQGRKFKLTSRSWEPIE